MPRSDRGCYAVGDEVTVLLRKRADKAALRSSTTVTAIHPDTKSCTTEDGRRWDYVTGRGTPDWAHAYHRARICLACYSGATADDH